MAYKSSKYEENYNDMQVGIIMLNHQPPSRPAAQLPHGQQSLSLSYVENHSVMQVRFRPACSRKLQSVAGISAVSGHIEAVLVGFAVNLERPVLGRIPQTVRHLAHLNPQGVYGLELVRRWSLSTSQDLDRSWLGHLACVNRPCME